jgi:preprotein translocase subunit SecG
MLLPFAFVIIAVFIVLAIVLVIRKSKGKKELNKETVSKERIQEPPAGDPGTENDVKREGN